MTEPEPFSFESRDKKMIQKKQEKILKAHEEEQKVFLMFTKCITGRLKLFIASFPNCDFLHTQLLIQLSVIQPDFHITF